MSQAGDAAPRGPALWWEAARPRTLPASIAPVLAGTAASDRAALWLGGPAPGGSTASLASVDVMLLWGRFLLALIVALALQIAVNYANDYFDGVRGVDTAERIGPRRVTASGLVTTGQMRRAIIVTLLVAAGAGAWLSLIVTPWLLLVGVAAGLATLGYSGGPRPYASAGLGEVFVFVFFGLVATVGSQFVQDERINAESVLAGVAMGLLAVALLVINNLRDIPTDARSGKRTLAVRLGESRTRTLWIGCMAGAYLVLVLLLAVTGEVWMLLPLLSVVAVWPAVGVVRQAPLGPRLIAALEATARGQLLYGALLTVAFLLRDPSLADVAGDAVLGGAVGVTGFFGLGRLVGR